MKYLILFIAVAVSINAYAQANTKLSNLVAPTSVNQDLLPNTNNSRSLGSAAFNWKNLSMAGSIFKGKLPFLANPGKGNTFLGIQAGKSNTSGAYNTIMGDSALFTNTTGVYNTAQGYKTLYSNTSGYFNTANGYMQPFIPTPPGMPTPRMGMKPFCQTPPGISIPPWENMRLRLTQEESGILPSALIPEPIIIHLIFTTPLALEMMIY